MYGDDEEEEDPLPDEQYGYPKEDSKKWASCVRVLDPKIGETTCLLALQDNEATFSICYMDDASIRLGIWMMANS